MNIDPETALLRARVLNGQKTKRYLRETAAKVGKAWSLPGSSFRDAQQSGLDAARVNRLQQTYDIQTREPTRVCGPVKTTTGTFDAEGALERVTGIGGGRPPENEPISVLLTAKDLEFCDTWEKMATVLGLRGVPNDRLTKPDGSPADFSADEQEDGLMVVIY